MYNWAMYYKWAQSLSSNRFPWVSCWGNGYMTVAPNGYLGQAFAYKARSPQPDMTVCLPPFSFLIGFNKISSFSHFVSKVPFALSVSKVRILFSLYRGLLIELGGEAILVIRSERRLSRKLAPLKTHYLIRICYARYADDSLLGIVGAVELLIEIQKRITHFLQSGLNLWVGFAGSITIAARNTVEFPGTWIENSSNFEFIWPSNLTFDQGLFIFHQKSNVDFRCQLLLIYEAEFDNFDLVRFLWFLAFYWHRNCKIWISLDHSIWRFPLRC